MGREQTEGINVTKTDQYEEFLVEVVRPWEAACYWCGKVFRKMYNHRTTIGWKEHINIEHETKVFCSGECKLNWIYAKQTFGVLLP